MEENTIWNNINEGKYNSRKCINVKPSIELKKSNPDEYREALRKFFTESATNDALALELFRSDVEKFYGTERNPKAQKIWSCAYDLGHSYGYHEILNYYEDLLPIIENVDKMANTIDKLISEFDRIDKLTPWSETEPEWWIAWSKLAGEARILIKKVRE